MTTNDQASFLNRRDRARIWRAFCGMRYAAGLGICRMSMREEMTADDVIEALEQLSKRLVLAAEAVYANEVKLREHDDLFGALGALANLIGKAQKEAWKR
jgi:hypothetical protein